MFTFVSDVLVLKDLIKHASGKKKGNYDSMIILSDVSIHFLARNKYSLLTYLLTYLFDSVKNMCKTNRAENRAFGYNLRN